MISSQEILIRLLVASLFGALIGLERERKERVAGLRTHMMVSVGSCLIMIVSAFGFLDILDTQNVSLDPSRIAAQVVSGIGFIGAGTIIFLKHGAVIRGLTTAAGLWTVAAIGLATGGGLYFAAGTTTFIAILILWAIQPLEQLYSNKFKHKTIRIEAYNNINHDELIQEIYKTNHSIIQDFSIDKTDNGFIFQFTIEHEGWEKFLPIIDEFKSNSNIKSITWF